MDTAAADWDGFFAAMAGAAAALAGLLMVAISVNIKEILAGAALPARAATAVGSLVLVVVIAGAGLIPAQPAGALGAEIVLAAAGASVLHVRSLRQTLAAGTGPGRSRGWRVAVALAQMLPLLAGGFFVAAGVGWALHLVGAGILVTVLGSMLDAWVLMVEILR